MKKIYSVIIILFISIASLTYFTSVQAQGQAKKSIPAQACLGNDSKIYLPVVAKCDGFNSSYTSPFSLQLAALHQVTSSAPASSPADYTQMGLQDQAYLDAAFPSLLNAIKESGAGWTRVYVKWSDIEPDAPVTGQSPVYKWSWYDQKLSLIAESGVRVIATVADAPSWAASTPCSPLATDSQKQFARFLQDLVQHYKQAPYNIKHWEIINEPDNTWSNGYLGGLGCWGDQGKEYAAMLSQAYPAIKAADPGATVLMGGVAQDWFSDFGGRFYRYFMDDVFGAGNARADVLNFHYFPDFSAEWERWNSDSQDRLKGWLPAPTCGDVFDGQGASYEVKGKDVVAKTSYIRNRMSTCFGVNKPIWITELAAHGYENDPVSLDQQASYVIMGYARALSAGVQNITWYALATPNDSYQQGLLYDDWSPKPAFYAYKTLTHELDHYQYSRPVSASNVEGYVFKSACGSEKTVFWGTGSVAFKPAARIRLVDKSGTETFITDGAAGDLDGLANRSITIRATGQPLFVEILN